MPDGEFHLADYKFRIRNLWSLIVDFAKSASKEKSETGKFSFLCRCRKKVFGGWREEPVPFLHFWVGMRRAFPSGNRKLEVAFSSRQSLTAGFVKSVQKREMPEEEFFLCLAVAGKGSLVG